MSKAQHSKSSGPGEDSTSPSTVRPDTWMHHSLLSIFVLIWGGNFVLAEVALLEMAPVSFSASRFLVGGGALIALLYMEYCVDSWWPYRRERVFPRLEKGDWPRLLLVAFIGGTLAPWLGIEGLGLTHGARASLWLALGPVLSSGIGHVWQTEHIGRVGYVGIGLAAVGTFVLAADGLRPESNYWLGDLLLFVALVLTVIELHLIQPLAARYGSTPVVAARTMIGGLLYLLVASPALVEEPWFSLGPWTWIAILFGGAVGVGGGQWVKVHALRLLGPTRVVLYGNLVPLATLLLAWVTIGTDPSILELLAGIFIVLGVFCLQMFDARAVRRTAGKTSSETTSTPGVSSNVDVESVS